MMRTTKQTLRLKRELDTARLMTSVAKECNASNVSENSLQLTTSVAKQKKATKSYKIFELFKKRGGYGVTQMDAIIHANYLRLAAWVYAQKCKGYLFTTRYDADDGHATYWLIGTPTKRKSANFLNRESANSQNFKQDKQA